MKLKGLCTALVTSILLAVPTVNASAQEANTEPLTELVYGVMESSDPDQAFERLNTEDKEAFVTAMEPTAVTSPPEEPRFTTFSTNGCWNQTVQQDYRSNFGFVTYRMYVSSHWCANNGRITSHSITGSSGESVAPGYSYHGITAQGAVNYGDRGVSAAQGHFKIWNAQDWIPGMQHFACAKQTTRPGSSSPSGHIGGACFA